MSLQGSSKYEIHDAADRYLTDAAASGVEVKLEGPSNLSQQRWITGTTLSNMLLLSDRNFYLYSTGVEDSRVTCVATADTASKWSLTGDGDVQIELLDPNGKPLPTPLYLIPTTDGLHAKISKNRQTWKFNPKPGGSV